MEDLEIEDSTPPTKEKNEEIFLNQIFPKFQTFQPGEQQFYISEINKLFQGNYTTVAIQEPVFSEYRRIRGRPMGAKRKHKSTTSTKREPSAFEITNPQPKRRGRPPKKTVKFEDQKVCKCF